MKGNIEFNPSPTTKSEVDDISEASVSSKLPKRSKLTPMEKEKYRRICQRLVDKFNASLYKARTKNGVNYKKAVLRYVVSD